MAAQVGVVVVKVAAKAGERAGVVMVEVMVGEVTVAEARGVATVEVETVEEERVVVKELVTLVAGGKAAAEMESPRGPRC